MTVMTAMTARRQSAIEGKMLRGLGMSPDARVALNAHNATQLDWHGWCQVCRTHVTGSIEALRVCPNCGAGAGVRPHG